MNFSAGIETESKLGKVLFPGLPVLPDGTERYSIPGGGSLVVNIFQHDTIILIDLEGLQPAEIILFDSQGHSSAGFLGATRGSKPKGFLSILQKNQIDAYQTLSTLKKLGFDLEQAEGVSLFQEKSPAGNSAELVAERDGVLAIAAPGEPMLADGTNPPSDLVLYVQRESASPGKPQVSAPPPLADAIIDKNVLPGSAFSYTVRKGQYIQIIDVKGRECSDFQAFDARALDSCIEREIDVTNTRSLMGSLYPTPGLFSKYFTVDQEPLVEIVQDTCGRHDTFGVACTARYYEDLGYPGHLNCSDNINESLVDYGIRPRKGWPAINFFFNTMIDNTNTISMDDPWSRPGDFVLLRAITDLICISTACPCDIDPANGWEPTDIQVRLYKENENFERSIGWRKTPEAEVENTKKTAFHECFAQHTRDFSEYNGYWLPNQMTNHGTITEYWACREKAAIMDLSPLRKYEITGPDSEDLLQLCLTRNIKKLGAGQVVYSAMCYEHGGMIDDGTVFRLGENNFRWIGGNDDGGLWLRKQAHDRKLSAWVKTSTNQLCNIALQGRLSRTILDQIIWTSPTQPTIEELRWFRYTIARLGDFNGPACVVSRTGYSGELGYEIFCHPKDATTIFDAIYNIGGPLGLIPLGLTALDILRIEAGLIFAGSEFSDQTDPFEAGIGFTVPLSSKPDDFIGRAALLNRFENPKRKLVGLKIEGNQVPNNGNPVYDNKAQIGEITSATRSPILGKVIALCLIDINYAEFGTDVEIGLLDGKQKRLRATTCKFPHFDPEKNRVNGKYS